MISKKLFPIIIFIYFFQYVSERNLNYFNFWQFFIFHSKMYDWGVRKSSFCTKQCITLVPGKSLMHYDIQKIISCHNFYLFFPIWKWKEFKLFQLLESFKKNVLMHRPSIKKSLRGMTVQWNFYLFIYISTCWHRIIV